MKRLLLVLGLAAVVGGMVMWRRQTAGNVPFDHADADATEAPSASSTPSPATVIDLTEQPAEVAEETAAPTT